MSSRGEAISRGQQARHARRIAEEGDWLPDRKRCSRADCDRAGEWLDADQFHIVKRRLKDGTERRYLKSQCRRCESKRKKAWKDSIIEQGGREAWLERIRSWNTSRTPEHRRRYNRQWWRRRHGKGIKVWKIYAHEVYGGSDYITLEVGPLADFLRRVQPEHPEGTYTDVSRAMGHAKSWLSDIMNKRQNTVSLEDVDAILLALGHADMLGLLYPLES